MPSWSPRTAASSDDRLSRRSFLANAGSATPGLAATAGLGATAGCVELLPAMGQEIRYGSVDVPEPRGPRYRRWLPDLPLDPEEDLFPSLVTIPNNDSRAVTGVPISYARSFFAGNLDYFGIGVANYDLAFSLRDHPDYVYVLEGPVAPGEVGSTLRESGYVHRGAHRGYERYTREDTPRTVAVQEGRIVFGTGPERDDAIRRALDAHEEATFSASASPGLARLIDRAGVRPFLTLGSSVTVLDGEYAVEWGLSYADYDEAGFYHCQTMLFGDDRPTGEEVRQYFEDTELSGEADEVEIVRDGRFLAIETFLSSGTAQSEFEEPGAVVPQITWGVEEDGGTIEIRHQAGEATPADRLKLRDGWSDGPALPTQFADEYSSVAPGASVSVDPAEIAGGPLTVRWEHGDTNATLLEYRP